MAAPKKKELHSPETRRQFEKHYRLIDLTPEQAAEGFKTGCWLWQATKDGDGYGQFRWNGELYRAHRFSYVLNVGEIEAGKDVDHRCNNYACVNPEHLQVVLHSINMKLQRERKGDNNPGLLGLRREITHAEHSLAQCLAFIEEKKIQRPVAYGVLSMEGAPWRAYSSLEGYDSNPEMKKHPELVLLALWLYAVSQGCRAYETGLDLLGVSGWTIKDWNANPDWKADAERARVEGRVQRGHSMRERTEDTLEAKLPFAEFKDAVKLYDVQTRNENARADRRQKKHDDNKQLGGPTINILLGPGASLEDLMRIQKAAVEREEALTQEGEFRVVDDTPVLPSGTQLDDEFEEAFADEEA